MDKKIMMVAAVAVVAVVAVAAVALTFNSGDKNSGDDSDMYKLGISTQGIVFEEASQVSVSVSGTGYSKTLGTLDTCNHGYAPKDAVMTLTCTTCKDIEKIDNTHVVFEFQKHYMWIEFEITGATVDRTSVDDSSVTVSLSPTSDVQLNFLRHAAVCDLNLSAPDHFKFQLVSSTDDGTTMVIERDITALDDAFTIEPGKEYYIRLTSDSGYKFDAMQGKNTGSWSVTYNDDGDRHSLYISGSGLSISGPIIYGSYGTGYGTYTDFPISTYLYEYGDDSCDNIKLTLSTTKLS